MPRLFEKKRAFYAVMVERWGSPSEYAYQRAMSALVAAYPDVSVLLNGEYVYHTKDAYNRAAHLYVGGELVSVAGKAYTVSFGRKHRLKRIKQYDGWEIAL